MRLSRPLLAAIVMCSMLLTAIHPSMASSAPKTPSATVPQVAPGSFLTGPNAGDPLAIAMSYLRTHTAELSLTSADLADIAVTDRYTDAYNGVTHIYLRQRFEGIEVYQANININIARDGSVINMGNSFIPNLRSQIKGTTPQISTTQAVERAAEHLGLKPTRAISPQRAPAGVNSATVLSDGGISRRAIPVKLVYQPMADGVRLAWDLEIEVPSGQNYWSMRVDAASGAVLDKLDYVDHDLWESVDQIAARAFDIPAKGVTTSGPAAPALQASTGSYNIFAIPVESPNFGSRTVVTNPADTTASPFGWHDTNGAAGAEFTVTRGNNVNAAEDGNNRGFQPNGGASLTFNFPLDLTQQPDAYESAAITNLFYANNIMHDVFYRYGFTEAAGNFQTNNYGHGGAANDAVIADAQDSSGTNNANFSTPADGSAGHMQMFLWNRTTPMRDGDLDNGVIFHEYGHGISNRLTGGPANSNCLRNAEQGGEGWSDWFALMLTMKAGDTATTRRPMGTYVIGQPTTGVGIRAFPYTTDMTVDPRTYDTIKSNTEVHAVGSTWTAIIWEVTWAMVNRYGFNSNIYTGTGGNNKALQLIVDGLKLQPCNPGFVNARDAILLADRNDFAGANQCLLWTAFAKRGLGASANQGSNNSATDGTQAFDLPASCSTATTIFSDDFETDRGWTPNPNNTDTATTGRWQRANPEDTNSSGPKQLGTTPSGSNDLVTGGTAGAAAGDNDIDGGTTSIRSPAITLPSSGNLNLTFSFYFAHGTNSSSADFFRVSIVGSTTTTVFQELGSTADDDASFATQTVSLNSFAGQTVRILIEAADASTASLVEAAVDDVRVTQQ
jgi:extracellular elastinolytic metalloproteinase